MASTKKNGLSVNRKNYQSFIAELESEFLQSGFRNRKITEKELSGNLEKFCNCEIEPDNAQSSSDFLYWKYVAFILDKNINSNHFKELNDALKKITEHSIRAVSDLKFKDFNAIFKSKDAALKVQRIVNDYSICNDDVYSDYSLCLAYIPAFIYHLTEYSDSFDEDELEQIETSILSTCYANANFSDNLLAPFVDFDEKDSMVFVEIERNLNEENFDRAHPKLAHSEISNVLRGMPGDVALRIAKSYLYGNNLPLDKESARNWLSYGMSVGNPYCALLFLLHFADVDLHEENLVPSKISDLFILLNNIFNLTLARLKEVDPTNLNFELLYDENNVRFDEACLYNVLMFFIVAHEEVNSAPEFPLVLTILDDELVVPVFKDAIDNSSNDTFTKALLSLFVTLMEAEGLSEYFLEKFLSNIKMPYKKGPVFNYIIETLSSGLKKHDRFSYTVYMYAFTSLKGNFDEMPKSHLKALSKMGFAKATFALGSVALESSESEAVKQWEKSSDQGLGFSYFNLSLAALMTGDCDLAIELATLAIKYDVVYAYYVLYRAYLKSNQQLAHSYLRIAAEYMFPEAVRELKFLRQEGSYNPLPYLKCLEEIEDLALKNYHASLFMCDVYTSGSILPVNLERTYFYQRQALLNGCYELFPVYKNINRISFPPLGENESMFVSYRKSLSDTQSFFKSSMTEEQIALDDVVIKKTCDLVKELCSGTSELEREVLRNLYNSNMWNRYKDNKFKIPKECFNKPERKAYQELFNALASGFYNTNYYTENTADFLKERSQLIECLKDKAFDYGACVNTIRALMCLRSLTLPSDPKSFSTLIEKAFNSGELTAMLLCNLNLDCVFDSDQSNVVKYTRQDSQIYDPDAVISSVSQ